MRRTMLLILLTWLLAGTALEGSGLSADGSAKKQMGVWEERAPMLTPRSEMSIAQLDGRIFAMGGYPGARVTSADVQVYDSRTDTWAFGPPLPLPLHHTMAAAAEGLLYVMGGEAGNPAPGESVFQDGVYVLDEQAVQWVSRAPMPTARSAGGAAVIDGKIYVAGGRPPRGRDFAVYEPLVDQWTVLPDLPTQRNHLAVAAIGDKVYVAGGRFGAGVGSEMTDSLEIYDPATSTWTTGAPMLAPRAGVASIAANGCLYVIGGEGNDADPSGVFDRNEVYNPLRDSWLSLAPLPVATHGLTGAAYMDDWIHVPGGATRRGVSGANVTLSHQVFRAELTCRPAEGLSSLTGGKDPSLGAQDANSPR